jgi:anti-sigma factor RsiW
MNRAPECEKTLLVQAELDGELDAAAAAALAAHRAQCPICKAAADELARARELIAEGIDSGDLYHSMPDDVQQRLVARLVTAQSTLVAASRSPRRWRPWWASPLGYGLSLSAAALLFFTFLPRESDITQQIVAGHIRALQPGHLEDVVSTDQHTVKPWFDGRIDFAPPVKDLAAERFPLRGGRLDYIGGRPVAALIYQHDKHLIDLFVWPAGTGTAQPPEIAARHGYNVVHWNDGGMALWAVSDLEANLLREFAEDWRGSP